MEALLEPFRTGIGRRAALECLALAMACGPLGVWVLLHRRAYAAESLSHGLLPGLVLAALAGVPLVLGALGGVLVAAGLIALASRDERLGPDVGVGIAVTFLFGAGAVLALSPGAPPRLEELLFGDLLGTDDADLLVAAVLAAAVLAALLVAGRGLTVAAFDPGPSRRADLVVLVLLGLTTVATVQGLGNLLAVALVLAPAAAALNVARRLPHALALSTVIAAAAGFAGLQASHHLQTAAGASVAAAAVLAFLATVPLKAP